MHDMSSMDILSTMPGETLDTCGGVEAKLAHMVIIPPALYHARAPSSTRLILNPPAALSSNMPALSLYVNYIVTVSVSRSAARTGFPNSQPKPIAEVSWNVGGSGSGGGAIANLAWLAGCGSDNSTVYSTNIEPTTVDAVLSTDPEIRPQ